MKMGKGEGKTLLTGALLGATHMNHAPPSASAKRDMCSHCAQVLILECAAGSSKVSSTFMVIWKSYPAEVWDFAPLNIRMRLQTGKTRSHPFCRFICKTFRRYNDAGI